MLSVKWNSLWLKARGQAVFNMITDFLFDLFMGNFSEIFKFIFRFFLDFFIKIEEIVKKMLKNRWVTAPPPPWPRPWISNQFSKPPILIRFSETEWFAPWKTILMCLCVYSHVFNLILHADKYARAHTADQMFCFFSIVVQWSQWFLRFNFFSYFFLFFLKTLPYYYQVSLYTINRHSSN